MRPTNTRPRQIQRWVRGLTGSHWVWLVLFPVVVFPQQQIEPRKQVAKYWFFFVDKGPASLHKSALLSAESSLLPKAKARRLKVSSQGALVDYTDLAVWQPYVDDLRRRGVVLVNVSKWLNAVSAFADEDQLRLLSGLPCISRYQPVGKFHRERFQQGASMEKPSLPSFSHELDYGLSLVQNELMAVPQVHDLGFYGQGVLIALLDTGFRLNHEAFSQLDVLAKYDFINKDSIVENESGQDLPSQDHHGSIVLSIIAGYAASNLIGPAFGASFLLAKTEDVSSETPIEEDYWIAAAEWADSLGADIISSSLGYIDWYEYADMNGDTAPITIAADLAAKKGILVVVAAGNEGNAPWHYISAPADGDSVVAVGAVSSSGIVAAFSSRGPSADGRIKPDVMAMGVSTRCIAVANSQEIGSSYASVNGTSAACPLAAGAAALILCAHPQLTPMQVRESLWRTADRAPDPDNTYGYGLVNALTALSFWGSPPDGLPEQHRLVGSYPNPFSPTANDRMRIVFDIADEAYVTAGVYNILGQKVATLRPAYKFPGKNECLWWNGRDDANRPLASGVYLCRVQIGSFSGTTKITLLH